MSTVLIDYAPVNGSIGLSALVVAIPLLALFVLLFFMPALYAGLISLGGLLIVASVCYLPVGMAFLSALNGFLFGIWPVCLIITAAIFLFDMSVITGHFEAVKYSICSISKDKRILTLIIAFCFSSFLEGCGGFSSPVAISAMLLCGLGIPPLKAAAAGLIGNTVAVPFGGVAIPVITLKSITYLPLAALSEGISRLMIPIALIMPFFVVWTVCSSFRELWGVWPAIVVAATIQCGATLIIAQFIGPQLCSILGGLIGTLGTAVFVKFIWHPKEVIMTDEMRASEDAMNKASGASDGVDKGPEGQKAAAAGEDDVRTPLATNTTAADMQHSSETAQAGASDSVPADHAATVIGEGRPRGPSAADAATLAGILHRSLSTKGVAPHAAGDLDSAPTTGTTASATKAFSTAHMPTLRESKESPANSEEATPVEDANASLRITVKDKPSSSSAKASGASDELGSPRMAVADHLAAVAAAAMPSEGRQRLGSSSLAGTGAGTPISSGLRSSGGPIVRIVSAAKPGPETASARLRGENPHRGIATSGTGGTPRPRVGTGGGGGATTLGVPTPGSAIRGRPASSSLSLPPGTILIRRTTLKADAIRKLDSSHLAAGLMPVGPTGTGGAIPISGDGTSSPVASEGGHAGSGQAVLSRGQRIRRALLAPFSRVTGGRRAASAGAAYVPSETPSNINANASGAEHQGLELSISAPSSAAGKASGGGHGGARIAGSEADLEEGGITTPLATANASAAGGGAGAGLSGSASGGRSRRAGTAEVASILQAPGVPVTQQGETVAPSPVDGRSPATSTTTAGGVVSTVNPALGATPSAAGDKHEKHEEGGGHGDAHAKEAAGVKPEVEVHYDALHPPTRNELLVAWFPWVFLVVLIIIWGIADVKKGLSKATVVIPLKGLNNLVVKPDPLGVNPPHIVAAIWTLDFLAATGTCIYIVAIVTSAVFRLHPMKTLTIWFRSFKRMSLSCLTICVLLSLGYLLKMSGMDSTLGLALAETKKGYPFVGPFLGFLGVALTGSITTTSVLFGSLQVVAAEKIGLNPVQMASANSVAGACGHIISTASMVVGAVSVGLNAKKITPVYKEVLPTAITTILLVCVWNVIVAYLIPGLVPFEEPVE